MIKKCLSTRILDKHRNQIRKIRTCSEKIIKLLPPVGINKKKQIQQKFSKCVIFFMQI